jgi:hypothetical protein
MISLPFLRETVLDAHQIGPSRLSWNASDVGFPELILAMRMEEIPFPYSLSLCFDTGMFSLLSLRTFLTVFWFITVPKLLRTAHTLLYPYLCALY